MLVTEGYRQQNPVPCAVDPPILTWWWKPIVPRSCATVSFLVVSRNTLKLQFLTVSHFSTWFSERSGSGFENGFPPSKILKNKWVVQKSLMGPKKWIFHHISRWLSRNLVIFNFWFFSPIFENPVYKGILCKRDLQKSKKKTVSKNKKKCTKNNFSTNSEYHQESISEPLGRLFHIFLG